MSTWVHIWLPFNKLNLQHLTECETLTGQARALLHWCSLNCPVYFDMRVWPLAAFPLTPSETWVGSWNTFPNLTRPDLEDFRIITQLGCVDSHARREVEGGLPGVVMRPDVRQRSGQCLEQQWKERISHRIIWETGKSERTRRGKRGTIQGMWLQPVQSPTKSSLLGRVSSTSNIFVWASHAITLLLLCWKSLSFDSWAWSAVTAVWREGCVCLAVCCLKVLCTVVSVDTGSGTQIPFCLSTCLCGLLRTFSLSLKTTVILYYSTTLYLVVFWMRKMTLSQNDPNNTLTWYFFASS